LSWAIRTVLNLHLRQRRNAQTIAPPTRSGAKPRGNLQTRGINACKGNLKTSCDFDYSGKMIEMIMPGLAAYRVGKKISYDGTARTVTDAQEANELLRRTYRPGWVLDG